MLAVTTEHLHLLAVKVVAVVVHLLLVAMEVVACLVMGALVHLLL
jgi:hypothetical protein